MNTTILLRFTLLTVIASLLTSCSSFEVRPHNESVHLPYEEWNRLPENS